MTKSRAMSKSITMSEVVMDQILKKIKRSQKSPKSPSILGEKHQSAAIGKVYHMVRVRSYLYDASIGRGGEKIK